MTVVRLECSTSSKQRVLQASELTPLRYIPDSQSLKQWLSDRGQARRRPSGEKATDRTDFQ